MHELLSPGASGSSMRQRLMTEVDAADFLRLSIRTLQAWRSQGRGPGFVRVGRAIRYRKADLIAWIDAQAVSP